MSSKEFVPSEKQQAVFDFVARGTGSAMIEAVAGSGKTTTIVQALKLIPSSAKVTFLAFNKKIATELQTRVPAHVKAATFHSQGNAAWMRFCDDGPRPIINGSKLRDLVKRHFAPLEVEMFGACIQKLVSLAKSSGVRKLLEDTGNTWLDLADHYDVQLPENQAMIDRVITAAQRLLTLSNEASLASPSEIDFDDMLYMPLLKDVPFYKSDWLFVDEAQDTNAVQLALLRRMLKPGGRLIAVGDKRQAIYGFRGADASAMLNIATAFNCITLPLTISYRCAQSVVRLAQSIVPQIQAAPTAPEGEVIHSQPLSATTFKNTDVVICRNTAPIVELAYQLIGKGIGCKVLGREIGQGLVKLVQKMGATDLDAMLTKLDTYAAREIAKFMGKGQEQRAEAVRDQVDCIIAIAGSLHEVRRTIDGLLSSIDAMFSDDNTSTKLTLCTAHKSKGLEWDRVFIHSPHLMPSKWARQAWQQEQEQNLMYVAWTRAKRTLVFLAGTENAKPTAPVIAPAAAALAPVIQLTCRERAIARALSTNTVLHELWVDDDLLTNPIANLLLPSNS